MPTQEFVPLARLLHVIRYAVPSPRRCQENVLAPGGHVIPQEMFRLISYCVEDNPSALMSALATVSAEPGVSRTVLLHALGAAMVETGPWAKFRGSIAPLVQVIVKSPEELVYLCMVLAARLSVGPDRQMVLRNVINIWLSSRGESVDLVATKLKAVEEFVPGWFRDIAYYLDIGSTPAGYVWGQVTKWLRTGELPEEIGEPIDRLWGYDTLQALTCPVDAAHLVREYRFGLSEVPPRFYGDPTVLEALVEVAPSNAVMDVLCHAVEHLGPTNMFPETAIGGGELLCHLGSLSRAPSMHTAHIVWAINEVHRWSEHGMARECWSVIENELERMVADRAPMWDNLFIYAPSSSMIPEGLYRGLSLATRFSVYIFTYGPAVTFHQVTSDPRKRTAVVYLLNKPEDGWAVTESAQSAAGQSNAGVAIVKQSGGLPVYTEDKRVLSCEIMGPGDLRVLFDHLKGWDGV